MEKKKKILFVIGSLKVGGAERNLSIVANELANNSEFDIEILLFQNEISFPLNDKIKVHSLDLDKQKKSKLKKAFFLYISLVKKVWTIKPFRAIGFATLGSALLAATFYPKVICRYDTHPIFRKKYKILMHFIFFNFYNVKKVIAPSSDIKKIVLPYFINHKKIRIIPNPIVHSNHSINEHFRLKRKNDNERFIIFVGRLIKTKRVDHLIDSFAKSLISRTHSLYIVGDGPEYTFLSTSVKQLPQSLQSKIYFAGYQPNPSTFIKESDFLVLPSEREGFPTVLVEALGLGIPVVSSNCKSGPSDIVVNGHNGCLYDLKYPDSLTLCLNNIASNLSIIDDWKKNAKKSVQKFSIDKIITEYINLFE